MPPAMVWNSLRAAAGLWLLALGMLPTAAIAQGPSVCLIRRLMGIECFGCGMTRAVSALLHGDWAGGLAYHPLSVVALPLLAWFVCAGRFSR